LSVVNTKEDLMGTPKSKVGRVVVSGPLAPFAEPVRSRLVELGYTPLTRVNMMRLVNHLSHWMREGGLEVADLTGRRIEEYFDHRRDLGRTASVTPASITVLVDVLAGLEIVPVEPAGPDPSAEDVLLTSFRDFLLGERMLAASTAAAYCRYAARFIGGLPQPDVAGLDGLTAGDVTAAVLAESATTPAGSAQHFVVALRALLRFCVVEGIVSADLTAVALGITGRRRVSLPQGISSTDARALLASCDLRRSVGRRDYAVLVVLLRLGLRAGEVAGWTLDDIDWHAGEVVVQGKGGRLDRLPLPADVGAAIAGYLRRGRPGTSRREVFLRVIAPIGPLSREGISSIVRHACQRAGVAPVGAHRLRHTMACEMTAAEVPLVQISQVLRHRSTVSTVIYARTNILQLRRLAQPWPAVNGDD
jgi:site-specific recombinase XerD